MAVLDTSFLIAVERRTPAALTLMDVFEERSEPLRVPGAIWIEYLFRLAPHQRARAVRTLERTAVLEELTRGIAEMALRMQHDLKRAGRPLAWHDLQVAATALHYSEPVVSTDKAFQRVPGLEVLDHG